MDKLYQARPTRSSNKLTKATSQGRKKKTDCSDGICLVEHILCEQHVLSIPPPTCPACPVLRSEASARRRSPTLFLCSKKKSCGRAEHRARGLDPPPRGIAAGCMAAVCAHAECVCCWGIEQIANRSGDPFGAGLVDASCAGSQWPSAAMRAARCRWMAPICRATQPRARGAPLRLTQGTGVQDWARLLAPQAARPVSHFRGKCAPRP